MKLVHWPLMGGLLHLVQRWGDLATRRWKKIEDMLIRFDRIHERDRPTDWQTDGQTPHDGIGHACIAPRGKLTIVKNAGGLTVRNIFEPESVALVDGVGHKANVEISRRRRDGRRKWLAAVPANQTTLRTLPLSVTQLTTAATFAIIYVFTYDNTTTAETHEGRLSRGHM